jgi:hypothetical protein
MSFVISGTYYPFFAPGAFLAAVVFGFAEEVTADADGVDSTTTLLVATLGCATDGAGAFEAEELLELELAGTGGGAGAGVLEAELPELELLEPLGALAAVFRFGIDPNVNDRVERCAGSGRAVGAGKKRLALAGAVDVAPVTLSSDFTCTFIFVTVVCTPPALCAFC